MRPHGMTEAEWAAYLEERERTRPPLPREPGTFAPVVQKPGPNRAQRRKRGER